MTAGLHLSPASVARRFSGSGVLLRSSSSIPGLEGAAWLAFATEGTRTSAGQGLLLQSFCIPAIHGGQMCRCREAQGCARAAIHGGQMWEVGQRMEQLPRWSGVRAPTGASHSLFQKVYTSIY